MKFKEYLEEKYINNNKEYAFLLLGRMPIAPKLWDRLEGTKEVENVYHVTSTDNIKNIYKIQGSKKQISTFTKGDDTVAMGVDTDGGVMFELSGTSTLEINGDAWTSLDRSGQRWWNLEDMGGGEVKSFDALRFDLCKSSKQILIDEFSDIISTDEFNGGLGKLIKVVEDRFTGKQKAKFIKLALDAAEKIIKKANIKKMIKEVEHWLVNVIYGGQEFFDEIVLHNIKVKKIYGVIPYNSNQQIEIRARLLDGTFEHKYDGWVTKDAIVDIKGNKPKVKSAKEAFGL